MINTCTTPIEFIIRVNEPPVLASDIRVLVESREGMEMKMSTETDPERLIRLALIRDDMNRVIQKYL